LNITAINEVTLQEKQDKKKEAEMMFEAWQREKNQVLR